MTKRRKHVSKFMTEEARAEANRQYYADIERRALIRDAEKVALRRIEVTGGDETALGCKSSGWTEYSILLTKRLKALAANRITKADQSARVFNAMGFKTGSGQSWTPRLINVAKFLLLGLMNERIKKPTQNRKVRPARRNSH